MATTSRTNDTRRRLLEASALVFLERGYVGASLAQIAARLHMTKGAFAYHYPSKRDIAVALTTHQASSLRQSVEDARSRYPDSGVRALVHLVLAEEEHARHDPLCAASSFLAHDFGTRDLGLPDLVPWWVDALTSFITTGVSNGELDEDVDPLAAAELVLATGIGVKYYLRSPSARRLDPLRFLRANLTCLGARDTEHVIAEVVLDLASTTGTGSLHTSL